MPMMYYYLFKFQSTHPHGVRREIARTGICPIEFQSTHPHGVRRDWQGSYPTNEDVSIHAPTRGATKTRQFYGRMELVSIHAPTRGATWDKFIANLKPSVSIHAPTRGATLSTSPTPSNLIVSIHAPTRGATLALARISLRKCCFNPRTHTGCDLQAVIEFLENHKFQSTHPHGVRPAHSVLRYSSGRVSIHAPTRGATHIFTKANISSEVSIHAPTRGATFCSFRILCTK